MTLEASSCSSPTAPAGIILFGHDERRRPHASYFADGEVGLARRAATLMSMHVLPVEAEETRVLAQALPRGRIFEASGKAFVPFVKQAMFDRLHAAAGHPEAILPMQAATKPASSLPAPKGDQGSGNAPGGTGGANKPPFDWEEIGIGSLVLATTGGPQEGWFEAVVVYTKADGHFELRWRDFPLDANITRHRNELALLHPGTKVEMSDE